MTRKELAENFDNVANIESELKVLERLPVLKRIAGIFAALLVFVAENIEFFYNKETGKIKWSLNPLHYARLVRSAVKLIRVVVGR